jgi:hypothetical protein
MIKRMEEKDFAKSASWFEKQTGTNLPRVFLGSEAYMYSEKHFAIASVSLFKCPPVAYIAWPIANPDTMPEERAEALKALFSYAEAEAIKAGCKMMLTYSSRNSVTEHFVRSGYVSIEEVSVPLIKNLGV